MAMHPCLPYQAQGQRQLVGRQYSSVRLPQTVKDSPSLHQRRRQPQTRFTTKAGRSTGMVHNLVLVLNGQLPALISTTTRAMWRLELVLHLHRRDCLLWARLAQAQLQSSPSPQPAARSRLQVRTPSTPSTVQEHLRPMAQSMLITSSSQVAAAEAAVKTLPQAMAAEVVAQEVCSRVQPRFLAPRP